MLEGRFVIAGLMLVIFASAVGVSFTYAPETRLAPLVIGIPGLILTVIQFVIELRRKSVERASHAEFLKELRMFAWFFFVVAGLIVFGFLYAGPALVAAYLYFSGREKWFVALIAAAVCWIVLFYGFDRLLGLPPWEGLISQWIYG